MKKNIITLVFVSILSITIPTISFASNSPSVKTNVEYSQFISKRQVVVKLLNDAVHAFNDPVRTSHAGFTAKMPSNLEIVTNKLLEAYQLEPYRTDLLISAANAQIYNKNVDRAIQLFEKALSVAPDDIDLHSYLAVWKKFKGDEKASAQHMQQIDKLNPGRGNDLRHIFKTIERILKTPLKDKAIQKYEGNTAIVTLGYALEADGSMNNILIKRLQCTLKMARNNPKSLIILSGGVEKNNRTEGHEMANWLVKKGISRTRIIEDNYATSTVDNALFSSYALARHNISHATIISSASHVRRGQTLFEIASWSTGPHNITFDSVAYPDKPLADLKIASKSELLGIYRDALRTYGLWSYRSKPLLAR